MAYHTGTVQAKDLLATIINKVTMVQPGETDAWWKKESSVEADGVYTSTGSTGKERIVIMLRPGTDGQTIVVGTAKDYTPGAANVAGAFISSNLFSMQYYSATQDPAVLVNYDLSVTKDRIILHVQGDKLISGWYNPVVYLGMPVRYDINDKTCIVRATNEMAPSGESSGLMVVENSVGAVWAKYTWKYIDSPSNPSWGNTYFLETFHFSFPGEGLRGELEGIYGLPPDNVSDGDIIDVDGTQFKIIKRTNTTNYNGFPRDTLAMKMK